MLDSVVLTTAIRAEDGRIILLLDADKLGGMLE